MPELRCHSCLFWLPAETFAWKAGRWVCERCRAQAEGVPRSRVEEVRPGTGEDELEDSEEWAPAGLAGR